MVSEPDRLLSPSIEYLAGPPPLQSVALRLDAPTLARIEALRDRLKPPFPRRLAALPCGRGTAPCGSGPGGCQPCLGLETEFQEITTIQSQRFSFAS